MLNLSQILEKKSILNNFLHLIGSFLLNATFAFHLIVSIERLKVIRAREMIEFENLIPYYIKTR